MLFVDCGTRIDRENGPKWAILRDEYEYRRLCISSSPFIVDSTSTMHICDMPIQLFMLLMTTHAGGCDE